MTVLSEIATVLQTTEKNVPIRLVAMRLAPVCNRCAGSGQYSFNQIHGTMCYGCNGKGCVAPKERDLPAMLIAAIEAAADGRLATYQRYLEAARTSKNATDRVMAAWKASGISDQYDWRKSFGENAVPRDRDIAVINKKMADAFESVSKVHLSSKSPTYFDDVIAFADTLNKALETVKAATEELQAYLSK